MNAAKAPRAKASAAPADPIESLRCGLEALGLGSERVQLRLFIGQDAAVRSSAPALPAALKKTKSGKAWALALSGRGLSEAGAFDAAAAELERAARELPEEACLQAWLAELDLLRGRPASARLEKARRLDPSYPWTPVLAAALACREGRLEAAEAELAAFERLRPGSAAGPALRAVLAAQRGDAAEAKTFIDRAAKKDGASWVLALRGVLRDRWGEREGALEDLKQALAQEDSAWVRSRRAALLNRMGFFLEAMEDLERVAAALPSSPEPLVGLAEIHLAQAAYALAAQRLTRALELKGPDASILAFRAKVLSIRGEVEAAGRDLDEACRLSPEDARLRRERLKLLMLRGRESEAEGLLDGRFLDEASTAFWLGYLRCRQRRYAQSRAAFERAAALWGSSQPMQSEQASFYAAVAGQLGALPPVKASSGPELRVIGLGYRHPFQVTLGGLDALRRCEAFYSNLSDERVADFLGLFPVPARAIVFRSTNRQADTSAADTMEGFKTCRTVGMVTRANPLIYGQLAFNLLQACQAAKITYLVAPTVGVFEAAPPMVGEPGGEARGIQVRNPFSVVWPLDPRLPLLIYMAKSDKDLAGVLLQTYPPEHPCYLLAGGGDSEFSAAAVKLSALREALAASDLAVTVFLPELR